MIAIDSSALVALFTGEDDADRIAACIDEADARLMSAATLLEASIVLSGTRFALRDGDEWLDWLVARQEIRIEPVTALQAQLAREAFRQYGKGRGHPAQLNFGDCFAYALAKAMDVPLLYKGNDFIHTDIASAL
ncbi:MAG: type II toxin-antitoxin system VapC family toxin [Hyphomicrobiales bacterium]|nr:MAG: type II toxin-antitoxin system VapC family toxin [Hyphomicrobiales bacterium]